MKKVVLFAAIATMGGASAVFAADKPCPPADAQKAQKQIDNAASWQQLNKAWKDWKHCDTGEVGETFTDALLRLLVDWKDVPALGESLKDDEYKKFVQVHLQSPSAKDDLKAVKSRAKMSCPKGQDSTCAAISMAAGDAGVADASLLAPMAPITPVPATK